MLDEIFGRSHLPQQHDETKISLRRSQVTECNELIELVQYVRLCSDSECHILMAFLSHILKHMRVCVTAKYSNDKINGICNQTLV